jgi:hypothetical protein
MVTAVIRSAQLMLRDERMYALAVPDAASLLHCNRHGIKGGR